MNDLCQIEVLLKLNDWISVICRDLANKKDQEVARERKTGTVYFVLRDGFL